MIGYISILLAVLAFQPSIAQRRNLHILSEIHSKFAVTNIGSDILNTGPAAREEVFSFLIPEKAFITNLTLSIGSDVIVANIKERSAADLEYERARRAGQSATLLKQDLGRGTQYFEVRANVAAGQRATFLLTYQQILERVSRKYRHFVHIPSDAEVDNVQVDVIITELNKVNNIFVPKPAPGLQAKSNRQLQLLDEAPFNEVFIDTYDFNDPTLSNTALGDTGSISYITYEPFNRPTPLDFIVLYDVEPTESEAGRIIQTVDGHFVHFISPDETESTQGSKKIVFAIDKSGSMRGPKWAQVQAALQRILTELKPYDEFNLVFFNHIVSKWSPTSVDASQANINRAVAYVQSERQPMGNTNISGAFQESLALLGSTSFRPAEEAVILLTDGRPTAGVTNADELARLVRQENRRDAFVHTLAFGEDADWLTLRRIASENRGLARKIYIDSDADIQLEDFYREVGAPMVSNLQIRYMGRDVEDGVMNDGSDMFVVGKLNEGRESSGLIAVVNGVEFDEPARAGLQPRPDRRFAVLRTEPETIDCTPITPEMRQEMERLLSKPDLRKRLQDRSVLCPSNDAPMAAEPIEVIGAGGPRLNASALPAYSIGGFVERFYVAATVARLLDRAETEPSTRLREIYEKQALYLSLKYNLVNRLTSLVAVDDKIRRIASQDFVPRRPGPSADAMDEDSFQQSCPGVKDICIVFDEAIGGSDRLRKRAGYFLEDLRSALGPNSELCLLRWTSAGRLTIVQDFGPGKSLTSLDAEAQVKPKAGFTERAAAGGLIVLTRRLLAPLPPLLKRYKISSSQRVVPVSFSDPGDAPVLPLAELHPLLDSARTQPDQVLAEVNRAAC